MIVKKEKLIARLKERLSDSDEDLSLLEDVTDSWNGDAEVWKEKAEEIDRAWRAKYKARFCGETCRKEEEEDSAEQRPSTYESLFAERK